MIGPESHVKNRMKEEVMNEFDLTNSTHIQPTVTAKCTVELNSMSKL